MKETGYITLWDVDCVSVLEDNYIFIIPKNKDDIYKINSHFNDSDFIIKYSSLHGHSTAFIERVKFGGDSTLILFPKYIIDHYHKELFSGFEITGESIDDFFRPSRYFYNRSKEENETNIDFIYNCEVADKWTIMFENKPVTVTLSYGDILRSGIRSDLMLHPKLTVDFELTTDIQYSFRVYSFIIKFLQIVRYDPKCGKLKTTLFYKEQEKMSYNGCLYDFKINPNQSNRLNLELEYGTYKPYVQRFLQFASDNPTYTFHHYPTEGIRFRGSHYSTVDFMNIFSAFESECHANRKLYENVDTTKIQSIKNSLIDLLDKYPNTNLSKEELEFLNTSRTNLLRQGTEFGQRRKIKTAYNALKKSLKSSIENIFFCQHLDVVRF